MSNHLASASEPLFADESGAVLESANARKPKGSASVRSPGPIVQDAAPSRIIAIAGGKGGVGKTVLTAAIGAGLAALGKRVVVVDADFGGSNLHTCLGVLEPERTFYDFFSLEVDSLVELLLDTPVANLKLVSGSCGTLGLANPRYAQKLRFIRELRRLPGDYVLMDLGAGSSYNVLDYFLACGEGIVVTTPDPLSLQECFNFIKVSLFRKLMHEFAHEPAVLDIIAHPAHNAPSRMAIPMDMLVKKVCDLEPDAGERLATSLRKFRPKLVVNRATDAADVREGLAICIAARELLGIQVDYWGPISDDPAVRTAVRSFRPFLLEQARSPAAQDLARLIAIKLLDKGALKGIWTRRRLRKAAEAESREYESPDLSEDEVICSYSCFYWGDCQYQDGGHPCRVRELRPLFLADQ